MGDERRTGPAALTQSRQSTRAWLYRHGVDAVNIPDGPRASARISPLVTAERVLQEAGIELILHFCSASKPDRIQADLLACAACGVRNILFVTGDPPKLGNHLHATGVLTPIRSAWSPSSTG